MFSTHKKKLKKEIDIESLSQMSKLNNNLYPGKYNQQPLLSPHPLALFPPHTSVEDGKID